MKKIIAMVLALVLVAGVSIAGTVAYLTATDAKKNTMTTGKVNIEQKEYQRVMDEDGNPVEGVEGTDFNADYGIDQSYKLEEFEQNKLALPAVYADGVLDWDDFQQLWNGVGAPGSNDLFDDSVKNVIDKFVFVQNTGNTKAYYRTIIAIEAPEGLDVDKIHVNLNANSRFDYDCTTAGNQGPEDAKLYYISIGNVRYLVYVATHTDPLARNEISRPSLLQVFLDPTATSEECTLFDANWEILTLSQAVQAGGFDDAHVALNAGFGEVTVANLQAWLAKVQ